MKELPVSCTKGEIMRIFENSYCYSHTFSGWLPE